MADQSICHRRSRVPFIRTLQVLFSTPCVWLACTQHVGLPKADSLARDSHAHIPACLLLVFCSSYCLEYIQDHQARSAREPLSFFTEMMYCHFAAPARLVLFAVHKELCNCGQSANRSDLQYDTATRCYKLQVPFCDPLHGISGH